MTDDNNARYRSSDPFSSRATGPDGQGSDPLAELARLIGQSDSLADMARNARPAAPDEPHYDDAAQQSDPPYEDRPAYDSRYNSHYDASDSRCDARYSQDPAPAPDWHNPPAPSYDPFAASTHQQPAAAPADQSYQDEPSEPRTLLSDSTLPSAPSRSPAAQPHLAGFDMPSLDAEPRRGEDFPSPPYASDNAVLPQPDADELYDDAPQGGRRKGVLTVAAVFCLAVVGTASAFGYRTWVNGPGVKAPPPVIKASADPKEVAPPPQQQADASTNNRFGDRGQNEKVVPREEKPAAARPPMAAPAPAPQHHAAVAPSTAPLDLANPAAPPPQVRAPAVRREPPPSSANAPLSLAPDSNSSSSNPLPAPTRSAPARVASAPATGSTGNGSYLVQVSSQRSEADAQAAFRSIKSKYSSVLGDRKPVIRRAELAGKGTYYRAMVGPFTSRDQAVQLCSSLKATGGDCVVQAN